MAFVPQNSQVRHTSRVVLKNEVCGNEGWNICLHSRLRNSWRNNSPGSILNIVVMGLERSALEPDRIGTAGGSLSRALLSLFTISAEQSNVPSPKFRAIQQRRTQEVGSTLLSINYKFYDYQTKIKREGRDDSSNMSTTLEPQHCIQLNLTVCNALKYCCTVITEIQSSKSVLPFMNRL